MQLDSAQSPPNTNPVDALTVIRLAGPIAIGMVGVMLMNTVDLIVVGRLGAMEMAAVGLGNIFWSIVFMPGLGMCVGVEFPVSFNYGARKYTECRRVLIQGVWICTGMTVLAVTIPHFFTDWIKTFVADKSQAEYAVLYFKMSLWGMWPTLVYTVCRIYLQALGKVAPAVYILILANVVNLVADLALVLGWWGFPKWEIYGAAYATNISRVFMCVSILGYLWFNDKRLRVLIRRREFHVSFPRAKEILRLGIPSGLQLSFESGIFSISTIMASSMDVISSAAHQAVLNLASQSYMIPLGISSAASVLVGQSLGRRDKRDLLKAGRLSYQLCLWWCIGTSLLFIALAPLFLGMYTTDPQVIALGQTVLIVAAAFQISDGLQVVAMGALRGLGDTRTSMLANLGGHWAIGLPVSYICGFTLGWGVQGIWLGFAVSLTVIAVVLYGIWKRKSSRVLT